MRMALRRRGMQISSNWKTEQPCLAPTLREVWEGVWEQCTPTEDERKGKNQWLLGAGSLQGLVIAHTKKASNCQTHWLVLSTHTGLRWLVLGTKRGPQCGECSAHAPGSGSWWGLEHCVASAHHALVRSLTPPWHQ